MSYQEDRRWSDQFIPEIKRLVGPHLLGVSSFEQDTREAADLVVLRANLVTIACRVRRPGFADRYGNEFTIRSARTNGVTTELEKIVNGWGDWMFYGHSDISESGFDLWWLLDLSAWRAHLIREKMVGGRRIRRGQKSNFDGATEFVWFDITSFVGEPNLVLAGSVMERELQPL